jgi:hypothetical protein
MIRRKSTKMIMVGGFGAGAYIFGGIILFFTAIFLFIEMFVAGFICLSIALFLIGYRSGTYIDADQLVIKYKWGFFVAFVEKKAERLDAAKAVVVSRHVSKVRANMRSGPTDFHVEIELPDKKVRVWEFYEHEKAWQFANELAEILNIGCYQGSEQTY